jgi:hypothetical protein
MRSGDNAVDIIVQLVRGDGSLQQLTGTETVAFSFYNWLGGSVLSKAGSISDIPTSHVKCNVLAADTSGLRGQLLRGNALITFISGAMLTFPTVPDDLLFAIY